MYFNMMKSKITKYTRRNSNWIKNLNTRDKITKLLEKLHALACSNSFLRYDIENISNKRLIDKLGFIKIKFYASKDTIKKVKNHPNHLRNICKSLSDNGLVSKKYRYFASQ